jgi:hypothetical protein
MSGHPWSPRNAEEADDPRVRLCVFRSLIKTHEPEPHAYTNGYMGQEPTGSHRQYPRGNRGCCSAIQSRAIWYHPANISPRLALLIVPKTTKIPPGCLATTRGRRGLLLRLDEWTSIRESRSQRFYRPWQSTSPRSTSNASRSFQSTNL